MKISVITLHRVFNFGSVLQAYATECFFKKLGFEAEIIDYIPENWQTKKMIFKASGKLSAKKMIYALFRSFAVWLKQKTIWSFLKKNVNLTKKYLSYNELCKNPPKADIYCTGSDQVWNSAYCNCDPSFYLQFGEHDAKRIAYAASFGKTEIDEEEKATVAEYLSQYSKLTLREDSAVSLVNKMGFEGTAVIDPTLQLDAENWRKIMSKRLIKEKYLILMLLYNEDNGATELARKIADKKGLKLIKISWEMTKPPLVDKLMTHRTPEDFLSLFNYADFVVTNSFHGLAFSINLNKQFVVVKRNEFNSRIESLLRLTLLEERLVDSEFDMNIVDKEIDYSPVNEVLEKERTKTYDLFKESLLC